jgi:glycosyltransferase involved in cell wall biosynthesis
MKILIIAYYYPPINTGGTARPMKMAKYLPEFGHDVTVLTHTYNSTNLETPGIIRVKDPSYNKDRNSFLRLLQWLGLRLFTEALNIMGIYHSIYTPWKRKALKLSDRIIEKVRPDIIIATYPPVETLEIGLYLSKRYNIPLISDFRDGLIFEPIETKRMKQYRCIRERYETIERETGDQSVAITTIADPISEYYAKSYPVKYTLTLSNGFDPDDFTHLPGEVELDEHSFNIVFTGRFNLSDKYNRVDFFFDAVRTAIKEKETLKARLKIHLVGEYRREELLELQDLIDAGIIIVHGFVEKSKALAFQRAADALLIITPPDRRSATSTKIFEYLYAGKPVLALTYKTVLEDIINETKSGWLVHPHETAAIAALLEQIVTDPDFYNSIKPDREKIDGYSVKSQLARLHHLLEQIAAVDFNTEKSEE